MQLYVLTFLLYLFFPRYCSCNVFGVVHRGSEMRVERSWKVESVDGQQSVGIRPVAGGVWWL